MKDEQTSSRELGFTALSSILHLALAIGIYKLNSEAPKVDESSQTMVEFEIASADQRVVAEPKAPEVFLGQTKSSTKIIVEEDVKLVKAKPIQISSKSVEKRTTSMPPSTALPEIDESLAIPDTSDIDPSQDFSDEIDQELASQNHLNKDLQKAINDTDSEILNNDEGEEFFDQAKKDLAEQNQNLKQTNTNTVVASKLVGKPTEGSSPNSAGGIRNIKDLRQKPGNKAPNYDAQDRYQRKSGEIILAAYVTKAGDLSSFKMIKSTGHRSLDLKTLKALKGWKFYPGQEGWVEIPFVWDLKGGVREMPTTLRRQVSQK